VCFDGTGEKGVEEWMGITRWTRKMGEKWAGGRVVGRWCFDVGGIGFVWFVGRGWMGVVCLVVHEAEALGSGGNAMANSVVHGL